jgi:hypothetical protein
LLPKYLIQNKNIEYSKSEKEEIEKSIYFKYSNDIIQILKKYNINSNINYLNENYYITTLLLSSKTIKLIK